MDCPLRTGLRSAGRPKALVSRSPSYRCWRSRPRSRRRERRSVMNQPRLGVLLNGVTGRMGYRQHLLRSVLAIREQGGVELPDGSRVQLEPILAGRNAGKLKALASRHDVRAWTTDVGSALSDPGVDVYFDAQLTSAREPSVRAAIAAGKHVYAEKPLAESLPAALELAMLARDAGVCHGVVHDKLF